MQWFNNDITYKVTIQNYMFPDFPSKNKLA